MSAVTRIRDRVSPFAAIFTGPLTRRDRRLWGRATNLPALCELTALWLEGRIASQPGYYGWVDVDEDCAPGLTETLVALNRAGYLTSDSQAGYDGPGYDGAHWQQLAAVTGYASPATVRWLRAALRGTRFRIDHWQCETSLRRRLASRPVTFRAGRPYTNFGQMRESDVAVTYEGCHEDGIAAVCAALQVTIYDPKPGPNDLWPVLLRAARRASTPDHDHDQGGGDQPADTDTQDASDEAGDQGTDTSPAEPGQEHAEPVSGLHAERDGVPLEVQLFKPIPAPNGSTEYQEVPNTMPEITGLTTSITYAEGMSKSHETAMTDAELFQAGLSDNGVSGKAIDLATEVMELERQVSEKWGELAAELAEQDKVREAYDATPGAGSREFVRSE